VLQKRIDHISELEGFESIESAKYSEWTDTRLDRWLVDWALRTDKPETARSLAKAKGIEVRSYQGILSAVTKD
jgi:hypothetical protein